MGDPSRYQEAARVYALALLEEMRTLEQQADEVASTATRLATFGDNQSATFLRSQVHRLRAQAAMRRAQATAAEVAAWTSKRRT